jgi:hypothetical protein
VGSYWKYSGGQGRLPLEDFLTSWCVFSSSSAKNKLFLFGLGVVCWTLWTTRNKMAIEKKLVKSPCNIIHYHFLDAAMEGIAAEGGAGAGDGGC